MTLHSFIRPPEPEIDFLVGEPIEALCDHDQGTERVRDWVEGIVVQVDKKLVAVQFNNNVFLTEGWMVPDRILWFPFQSKNIRPVQEIMPDY